MWGVKMRDGGKASRRGDLRAVRGPGWSDPHSTATARTALPQCDAAIGGCGGELLSSLGRGRRGCGRKQSANGGCAGGWVGWGGGVGEGGGGNSFLGVFRSWLGGWRRGGGGGAGCGCGAEGERGRGGMPVAYYKWATPGRGAAATAAVGRRDWVLRLRWLLDAGAGCCGCCGCWTPGLGAAAAGAAGRRGGGCWLA